MAVGGLPDPQARELGKLIDLRIEIHFANESIDLYTRSGRLRPTDASRQTGCESLNSITWHSELDFIQYSIKADDPILTNASITPR